MASEVDSSPPPPESELISGAGGVAIDVPVSGSFTPSPPSVPRRLRKRLSEAKAPSTVEDIETKLLNADLRRQQFYENWSSKARTKRRSPSRSSRDDDLGQRLEAKLQAAERKRLSIMENSQIRLARLDELRQAAKSEVEMRVEKEKKNLVTKVEFRVQQAEINRMLILKACRQRKARMMERTSRMINRRRAWENRYRECVHAAIHRKRVSAEQKRLELLEAEKRRASARVLQVRRTAELVSNQREVERRRLRDKLEDRLQRAKKQRAEYLKLRGRLHDDIQIKCDKTLKLAECSRKIARCWKQFYQLQRTTYSLAKDYNALGFSIDHIKPLPFEQVAALIESPRTLCIIKALLDRLETRAKICRLLPSSSLQSGSGDIAHLLKQVCTPKKRAPFTWHSRKAKEASLANLSRYPVRIVLCSYMILSHPDAVLSGHGERETALMVSAKRFVEELELLIQIILGGPKNESQRVTLRSQLNGFDSAWCSYLNCFAIWKVKDAKLLEDDLVRVACQLELSMMNKCKLFTGRDTCALSHDMKAIKEQVTEDQKLLKENLHRLSGDAGIEHLESALSEIRSSFLQGEQDTNRTQTRGVFRTHSSTGNNMNDDISDLHRSNRVVRSLFQRDSRVPYVASSSTHGRSSMLLDFEKLVSENELLINEFLHQRDQNLVDMLSIADYDPNSIQVRVREILEEAFWDGVIDSIKQEEPDYGRVIQLAREMKREISELAPVSWKEEIDESIDLDTLSQVLKSGVLDTDYLGKVLEFSVCCLKKLSSPAHEDELDVEYRRLWEELHGICQRDDACRYSHAVVIIKGLRFALEQIQVLKQMISKARIKLLEPVIKGPAGIDYLRNTFSARHGPHSDASTSLPLTMRWLSSVTQLAVSEWEEHKSLTTDQVVPSKLRTGGTRWVTPVAGGTDPYSAVGKDRSCSGNKIDLLVRVGLLKLVTDCSGLKREDLPETLELNFGRILEACLQFQKIVEVIVSSLVFRQACIEGPPLLNDKSLETRVSDFTTRLLELHDRDVESHILDTAHIICEHLPHHGDNDLCRDLSKEREIIARLLSKSLVPGHAVFEKVSGAILTAARAVLFSSGGDGCRRPVESALRNVGALTLVERVVKIFEPLVSVATVSVNVHGPWYANLCANM